MTSKHGYLIIKNNLGLTRGEFINFVELIRNSSFENSIYPHEIAHYCISLDSSEVILEGLFNLDYITKKYLDDLLNKNFGKPKDSFKDTSKQEFDFNKSYSDKIAEVKDYQKRDVKWG